MIFLIFRFEFISQINTGNYSNFFDDNYFGHKCDLLKQNTNTNRQITKINAAVIVGCGKFWWNNGLYHLVFARKVK